MVMTEDAQTLKNQPLLFQNSTSRHFSSTYVEIEAMKLTATDPREHRDFEIQGEPKKSLRRLHLYRWLL